MCYTMMMPTVLMVDNNNENLAKMVYILNNWTRMLVSYGKIDGDRMTEDFNLVQSILKCATIPKHIKRALTSCRDRLLKKNPIMEDLIPYLKKVTAILCEELENEDIANIRNSRVDKRMTKRYRTLINKIENIRLKGTTTKLCDTDIETVDKHTARTVRRIVEKRAAQDVARSNKRGKEYGNAFRQTVRRATSFGLFASYREVVDSCHRDAYSHWSIITDKNNDTFIRKRKVGYNSEEEAMAACAEYMTAHPDNKMPMTAYLCPSCGKWHIGHERFSSIEIA